MLQGDLKQVCQGTTKKFRNEQEEERRWLAEEGSGGGGCRDELVK